MPSTSNSSGSEARDNTSGDNAGAELPTISESSGSPGGVESAEGAESTEGQGASTEPGFGDIAGSESLPDMRDELPTFEESYGEDPSTTSGTTGSGEEQANSGNSTDSNADKRAEPGTRANGDRGNGIGGDTAGDSGGDTGGTFGNGTLTTAEQVAILDGQLEQSTSDFDAMILEEQQRQREMDRARAERTPREQAETAGAGTSGRNPYESDVAMGETAGGGSAGGGMGGGMGGGIGGGAPQNPAINKPPKDIPDGNNDDVVARQLREAAMREPDPEVRERLWNEYRKYKGIEITK